MEKIIIKKHNSNGFNKDMHNIIGLVIPTNEPYTMRTYLLPSLKNITDLSDIMNICLNFQIHIQ